MIELHERLSEYSYGYGVTREVERLLAGVGIRTVPFLPSLLQEGELAFDVGFQKPGRPLLLQFKLGQSLGRFRRATPGDPIPLLTRPFFRFSINTAEPDGQFETLLKSETDGAEVYYVAPRFADWGHYVALFEQQEILRHSLMVTPQEIRNALDSTGATDGRHRIVYDDARVHVCSKPVQIRSVDVEAMANHVAQDVRSKKEPLGAVTKRVFAGLERRASVRRPSGAEKSDEIETASLAQRMSSTRAAAVRGIRLTRLRDRSRSEDDAIAMALGLELWGLGIQLLFAVDEPAG